MVKAPFIWLGAGRAAKRGVARFGQQLDKVARARLPVPKGAILLDELFRIFLHEGVVSQLGNQVNVADPLWLLEVLYRDVRFPRLQTTADLSAISTDDIDGPLPPEATVQDVDLEDADQVSSALGKVWSYLGAGDGHRRDVLLLTHVEAVTSGRAVSHGSGANVIVNDTFAAHDDEAEYFSLPHLGAWQRPSPEYPPYARRLQMLLRGVRRTLGKEQAWDLRWVDDGDVCWIVSFN